LETLDSRIFSNADFRDCFSWAVLINWIYKTKIIFDKITGVAWKIRSVENKSVYLKTKRIIVRKKTYLQTFEKCKVSFSERPVRGYNITYTRADPTERPVGPVGSCRPWADTSFYHRHRRSNMYVNISLLFFALVSRDTLYRALVVLLRFFLPSFFLIWNGYVVSSSSLDARARV